MRRGRTLTTGSRRTISSTILPGGKSSIPVFDTLQEMREAGYLARTRKSTLYRGIKDEAVAYEPQVGKAFRHLSTDKKLKLPEGSYLDDMAAFERHSRGESHPQAISTSFSLDAAVGDVYTGKEGGAILFIRPPEEAGGLWGTYLTETAGSDLDEYAFKNIIDPERIQAIVSSRALKEYKKFRKATRPKSSALERYSHLIRS